MDARMDEVCALAEALRDRLMTELDDVEVSVECADRTRYVVEGDAIVAELERDAWRIALRALRGGRLATAATSARELDTAAAVLSRALAAAQPDPLPGFAVTEAARDVSRNADAGVWSLVDRPAEVRALASALASRTRDAGAGAAPVLEAEVSVGRVRRAVVTGRGAVSASASTGLDAFAMLDGNDWDAWSATHAPSLDPVMALGEALRRGLPEAQTHCGEFFGGPQEVTVVLHPRLVEQLLRTIFLERVGLDRVLSGLSPAALGDTLAAPGVTLWDDTGAAGSRRGGVTDDEGVVGQRTEVLRDGVLRSFVSDRRAALQAGHAASTGNGFRLPMLNEDRAEAPVRVGFGHLEMAAGTSPWRSLVRGKTLLLTDLLGLHSANRATGAFNNPVQGGLALEDGVAVARLTPGAWAVTGNLYALLKAVTGVSSERVHTGTALLPYLAGPVRVA